MIGQMLAAMLWVFEQWGAGYVLPGETQADQICAWQA